ncbi:Transcriptional regulator, LysR family [Labilithrix luteola]|uniref:Transcriptional regulator, LysR family n=1 Tax=Labilithrix luteola TaxID=1391654 RepID=A0A0K1PZC9_9BACT|nr:LysR family transcriptional regulator [Labilithrix luteola]AKU98883.1 Transcriptional regulator, LysR family [Labilithrix luteola]
MAANSQDQSSRWDDVRIFLAAHRMKSLGAAAARLGLDTSTVSRRLTAFEESLGTRLFERTREGIVPTHAAESLVPAAEAMEAAHARLTRDASSVEAEAEGTVRISTAPGIADTFVAPSLVRLRKHHPKITVELDASTTARDLTRHEADIALRSLEPQGSELVITKVATAPWLGAAHPALVKELGKLESWADAPWITWDRDLAGFPPARWVATHAAKAPVALRTSHFSSQLAAARTGLGIVLVPKPYLAPHELVPIRYDAALTPSADAWPSDDLWLVGHRALRDVPRIAVVWEFLANEMRRITGG